jgi:hypothetical protein
MIPRLKTEGYSKDGIRLYHTGGGSPGPSNVTSTTNTSNIPDYAQPYVSNMLGATENQLFKTTTSGTDALGNPIQSITGFQPYQAYGGVYDANGKLTNATEAAQSAVAGFQPLQTQAQQGIGALTGPQTYGQAMDTTNQGISQLGQNVSQAGQYGQAGYNAGMSYGQNAANQTDANGNVTASSTVQNYMNPYLQSTLAPALQLQNQQFGMQQAANQGRQTQAGAFGGSRGTLEDSLNQQNQMLAQNQLVGNAYNQAYNTANQNMQQAASLGMQGAQQGMAGVQTQQAGINAGLQGAQQLSNLGQQQQTNQENIYNLQNQYGGQQQQYNQNVTNQALQNYANAQQYPIMELGTMSNMLRGLPMQATTTNQYQATPSLLSQGIGAAGVGATLSSLINPSPSKSNKKGGLQNTTGINSYDVGGTIRADLENMPDDALQEELKKTQSPTIKSDIQQIMAMRSAVPKAKAGGIMSYAAGEDVAGEAEAAKNMQNGINTVDPEFKALPQQQQDQQLIQSGLAQTQDPTMRALFTGQMNDYTAKANASLEDIVQKKQTAYDKLLGTDSSLKNMMEEKANAKAEGERQRQLRLGQFFAMWGSTPGPTLVAGLKSFAQSVPGMITDSDKQADIMQRIDTSINQINKADRLEKIGWIKDAEAEKKQAALDIRKLNEDIVKWNVGERQNAERLEREKMKEVQETKEKALDRESREKVAGITASGTTRGYEIQDIRSIRDNIVRYGAQEQAIRNAMGKVTADPMYKTHQMMLNNPDATPEQKAAAQKAMSDMMGTNNENALIEAQLLRKAYEKELMGKDKSFKPSGSSSGSVKDLTKYDK